MAHGRYKKGRGKVRSWDSFAGSEEAARVRRTRAALLGEDPDAPDDTRSAPAGQPSSAPAVPKPGPIPRAPIENRHTKPFYNIARIIEVPDPEAQERLLQGIGGVASKHVAKTNAVIRMWGAGKLYVPLLSAHAIVTVAQVAEVRGEASQDILQHIMDTATPQVRPTLQSIIKGNLKLRENSRSDVRTIGLPLDGRPLTGDVRILGDVTRSELGRGVIVNEDSVRYVAVGISDQPWAGADQHGLDTLGLPEWQQGERTRLSGLQVVDMNEIWSLPPLTPAA